jgi:hypothetical protein
LNGPLLTKKKYFFLFFCKTEQQQWRSRSSKQQEEELELPRQDVGRDQELVVAVRAIGPTATGVNFIKILHATFLYKSASRSFSLIAVWLCIFLAKAYQCKSCS